MKTELIVLTDFITKPKQVPNDERFPFRLGEKDARRIINIACDAWKRDLIKKWGYPLLAGVVEIREDFYKAMRKECTPEQNELFDDIFGTGEKYISDGTPCLVRSDIYQPWEFRYANGKGDFYMSSRKSGRSIKWEHVHILNDLNNLPVNE